jgi:hypothetical protein
VPSADIRHWRQQALVFLKQPSVFGRLAVIRERARAEKRSWPSLSITLSFGLETAKDLQHSSPKRWGPFQVVTTDNGTNVDFMNADGVSETEFDEIFSRVRER